MLSLVSRHRIISWLFSIIIIGVLAIFFIPEPMDLKLDVPDPMSYREPVIQVYGANVWGIRGRFAMHTWIAIKSRNATSYTLYQVIGWRLHRTGTALSIAEGKPDRRWFGSPAILLADYRGEVDDLVAKVHAAALSYPFARQYTMWPGPNSNSFTAWVALEVPEMELDLPFKALGKNWMQDNYAGHKTAPADTQPLQTALALPDESIP